MAGRRSKASGGAAPSTHVRHTVPTIDVTRRRCRRHGMVTCMTIPGRSLASVTNEIPRAGEKTGVRERTKAAVVGLFLHQCRVFRMNLTMPCLVLSLHVQARRHHSRGDRPRAVRQCRGGAL